jgi:hypothetical protein
VRSCISCGGVHSGRGDHDHFVLDGRQDDTLDVELLGDRLDLGANSVGQSKDRGEPRLLDLEGGDARRTVPAAEEKQWKGPVGTHPQLLDTAEYEVVVTGFQYIFDFAVDP